MSDILSIDLEAYSPVDLKRSGVYPYASHPEFEILLMAYAFNDDPVKIIDLAQGERIPDEVISALSDPAVIKSAYNAQFERVCLSMMLARDALREPFIMMLDPAQWSCTMAHGLYLGLPGSLAELSQFLFRDAKQQKFDGWNLIRYFCIPCKPSKVNGGRTRNLPAHDPEKWARFKEYCIQDVAVERRIREILSRFPLPGTEQQLYALDQRINDRGVRIDTQLVQQAIACDEQHKARLLAEAVELTGLHNPNSVAKLKDWLFDEDCLAVESLNKETVPDLLKQTENEKVRRVLELRQQLAKTSVKKYQAMERALCSDDRVRGLLQYYGANRTGRWAGRLVQIQNLPQNKIKELAEARQLLRSGDFEMIEMLFGDVQSILSQLIRTAFIPGPGKRFFVADSSAIEARIIAWLAGEQWRMKVFEDHGYIYEASASAMFHVPWEEFQAYIDKDQKHPLRQKGKVAELALGFQGAVKALIAMGALKMGLTEDELPGLVKAWRQANPAIVQLWADTEAAATTAVRDRVSVDLKKGIRYSVEGGFLFAHLPSGRRLAYARPRLEPAVKFPEKMVLTYDGIDQDTKKWGRLQTYGGKLVENLVQAIARDCLAVALERLDRVGYKAVMHIHDEVVIEDTVVNGSNYLNDIFRLMSEPIAWARLLPLRADGFESEFYKKDD